MTMECFARIPDRACEVLLAPGVPLMWWRVYTLHRWRGDWAAETSCLSVSECARLLATTPNRVAQAELALEQAGLLRREWSSKVCRKIVFPGHRPPQEVNHTSFIARAKQAAGVK